MPTQIKKKKKKTNFDSSNSCDNIKAKGLK
jgi:hypothetical protein